ncbi:response regulator [Pseudanabaena sp. FACHB-2040]|uniref:response regulator n=1 Tax=Pseudanabaena sp. FACHB-2040 TaxID=2692859 RepID=UPI001689CC7A|nr:response regulator [Pseudanabaena sp. FACHB-2040]MBD2257293.1 response regulator [Pseudanabaena sp. FACHB-2040]
MSKTHRYILVLDTQRQESSGVHSLLTQLHCPVFIAGTAEQALAKVHQVPPYLVILIGDGQNWSQPLVEQLRQGASTANMTIVALTDSTSPRWGQQDENPGLDGFLVKPLSGEVLTSLVESALAKQS